MIGFGTTSTPIDGRLGWCTYRRLDQLREHAPAVVVELPGGGRAWLVTRGEVVRRLVAHPGVATPGTAGDHRTRALVGRALAPARVDALRHHLVRTGAALLDELASAPAHEPVDLHAGYSWPLSTRVAGDLLGGEPELAGALPPTIREGARNTAALIDAMVHELLTNHDQLGTVLTEPRRWPDAVEETLRAHCPAGWAPLRRAVEDIDLGDGVLVRAGDTILVDYLAHGRDPGPHEDPDIFDLDRTDPEHLAFGTSPHECPGAYLARVTAMVAVPALFDRFPGLTLAGAPAPIERALPFADHGAAALPVLLRHRTATAA